MANDHSITAYPLFLAFAFFSSQMAAAAGFTPTHSIPLEIVTNSPAYARRGYDVARLIDGNPETEFASESGGTNTFVTLRFPSPQTVIAFRHMDRADRALIARSELIFTDAAGATVERLAVTHVDRKAGETLAIHVVGRTDANRHIETIRWNGEEIRGWSVPWRALTKGGTLEIKTTSAP